MSSPGRELERKQEDHLRCEVDVEGKDVRDGNSLLEEPVVGRQTRDQHLPTGREIELLPNEGRETPARLDTARQKRPPRCRTPAENDKCYARATRARVLERGCNESTRREAVIALDAPPVLGKTVRRLLQDTNRTR